MKNRSAQSIGAAAEAVAARTARAVVPEPALLEEEVVVDGNQNRDDAASGRCSHGIS